MISPGNWIVCSRKPRVGGPSRPVVDGIGGQSAGTHHPALRQTKPIVGARGKGVRRPIAGRLQVHDRQPSPAALGRRRGPAHLSRAGQRIPSADAARFESCHPNRRNRPVASPTMGDATNAWTFIQRFVATVDYGQQQGWVDDGQGRTCPGLRRGGGRSVPEAARHQLLASWRYFSEFRTGDELLLVDALRHRMATHGGTNRGTPSTPLDHVGVRLLPPISSDGKRAFLTFRWLYCLGALVDLSDARSREQFRETPHDRGGSKRPTLVMALFSLTPPSLLAAGRSTDYIGTNCLRQPRLRFTQAVNHRRSKWLGFPRDESSSTHQQDR